MKHNKSRPIIFYFLDYSLHFLYLSSVGRESSNSTKHCSKYWPILSVYRPRLQHYLAFIAASIFISPHKSIICVLADILWYVLADRAWRIYSSLIFFEIIISSHSLLLSPSQHSSSILSPSKAFKLTKRTQDSHSPPKKIQCHLCLSFELYFRLNIYELWLRFLHLYSVHYDKLLNAYR